MYVRHPDTAARHLSTMTQKECCYLPFHALIYILFTLKINCVKVLIANVSYMKRWRIQVIYLKMIIIDKIYGGNYEEYFKYNYRRSI